MAGWLLLMTAIAVAGREATRELSVFQVMLLRSIIGLVVLAPLVHAAGGLRAMRTKRLANHGLRNVVHYAAQAGWLAALALIPLAQVVALEFTMPIWTALLAIVTALVSAADTLVPALSGLLPPWAYALVAIAFALLPSVLERRGDRT